MSNKTDERITIWLKGLSMQPQEETSPDEHKPKWNYSTDHYKEMVRGFGDNLILTRNQQIELSCLLNDPRALLRGMDRLEGLYRASANPDDTLALELAIEALTFLYNNGGTAPREALKLEFDPALFRRRKGYKCDTQTSDHSMSEQQRTKNGGKSYYHKPWNFYRRLIWKQFQQ